MKTKEEIEKIYNEMYGDILPSSKYTSKESFIEGFLACQQQQSDAVKFAKWIDEKYPLLHLANEEVRTTLYEIFKKEKI